MAIDLELFATFKVLLGEMDNGRKDYVESVEWTDQSVRFFRSVHPSKFLHNAKHNCCHRSVNGITLN